MGNPDLRKADTQTSWARGGIGDNRGGMPLFPTGHHFKGPMGWRKTELNEYLWFLKASHYWHCFIFGFLYITWVYFYFLSKTLFYNLSSYGYIITFKQSLLLIVFTSLLFSLVSHSTLSKFHLSFPSCIYQKFSNLEVVCHNTKGLEPSHQFANYIRNSRV
jgi:hypothetical protein